MDLGCPSCDPPVAAAEAVEDFVETATWRSVWRDVKVYDHFAIIVSEAAGHGLQIFDLERLDPSHARHDKRDGVYDPDARTTFGGSLGSAHNVVVNEETARAYAVGVEGATGSSTCNGGLLGVDIRDPTMPKWLGCLFDDAYVHDAQCVVYRGPDVEHFGREICFLSTESEVRIVDVTDASDGAGDVTLSLLAYEGAEYAHQGWLTCDHTTLFVDDELDELYGGAVGTKTYVLDVADLDAPRVRFVHTADTAFIDHNQYVNGAFLYQANYAGGLRILDISNAELDGGNLTEVAHFDLVPSKQGNSWDGAWNVYPFLASGRVVVNEMNSGMAIVKPSGLLVETRSRRVTARSADDVCPNLFQERSCAAATEPTPAEPTPAPTPAPTPLPGDPTAAPIPAPTGAPEPAPTTAPTTTTTAMPTTSPTAKPKTAKPTASPTAKPSTASPTAKPTTAKPTASPTAKPSTASPTAKPTAAPSPAPSPAPVGDAGEFGEGDGDFTASCATYSKKRKCPESCKWKNGKCKAIKADKCAGKKKSKCQTKKACEWADKQCQIKCKTLKKEKDCKAHRTSCKWKNKAKKCRAR